MFKKIKFKSLNYDELNQLDSHTLKKDELKLFYQTFDFLNLIEKWPSIVGPKLALVTCPLKIKFDSLFIITKHSIFSQELSFLSEEIKKEIFKIFPHLNKVITKLVFQTQESFFQQKEESLLSKKELVNKLHPQSPLYRIRKNQAEKIFNEIDDNEIKKLLTSIFIQS
jgi:hypothetical protein